jgi:cytosine/adenosine deaminase-related metal-dependent hydrolase
MATVDGASAIGRADDIGRLLPGYKADFAVLDPTGGAADLPLAARDTSDRPRFSEAAGRDLAKRLSRFPKIQSPLPPNQKE